MATRATAPAVTGTRGQTPGRTAPVRRAGQGQTASWRSSLAGVGFVIPFLVAYGLFLVWPVIQGFRMSLFNWSLTGSGTTDFLGLGNYREAWADPNFWSSLWHTVLFTLLSTPPLVILSLILALLANRVIPARWLFRLAFFAPYLLPVSVVTLIWGWLYQPGFGLINGYLTRAGLDEVGWLSDANVAMISIVITTVWWTIGFNFVLYLAGLQEISPDIYEAAALDGATGLEQVRSITLPLLARTTTLILVLQVLASLKVFDQIFLLTNGGPNFSTRPIIQYVYEQGFTTYRVGFASAISYIFFLLIIVISLGQFALLGRRRERANG
ncbi:MAG: ABC transporter, permease protein 1 (cluster 1, maltose/g3p/polyamine/iron) [uncultured Thermomicrobiales bacterium]|uniref:ABC transporter, permease protein 1 (Cluster 1, maltose/g3p/polyamine/iron) n=1 Tax=uncultured Thermomicrobiales bacterium TaxID=1645740 RepID=A0A6J4U8B5_9BACT|nr:MAG: ABC transporter, permease protein 1 (cluster 1, maltose/g3p/polyamine/iron) [uncultured Thermomicrobiales bacterium]